MKKIVTIFLVMGITNFCSALNDTLKIRSIKFYNEGSDFLWRNVDALDDPQYLTVKLDRQSVVVKSYSGYTHLESPVSNWGFIVVKENDIINVVKKNNEWIVKGQNTERTNELLFFHGMYGEIGNPEKLYEAAYLKKFTSRVTLMKEVELKYKKYYEYLIKYNGSFEISDEMFTYYNSYLNVSFFNIKAFIEQSPQFGKANDDSKRRLLLEVDTLLKTNQWDNPIYRKMILNYFKLKNTNDLKSVLENEDNQNQTFLRSTYWEYYLFNKLKFKIELYENDMEQCWQLYCKNKRNEDFAIYLESLIESRTNQVVTNRTTNGSILNDTFLDNKKGRLTFSDILTRNNFDFYIIDFWASWCGPCRQKIPKLMEMKKNLPENIGILFLSIDRNVEAWNKAVINDKISDELSFLFQSLEQTQTKKLLKLESVPRYALIDKKGNLLIKLLPEPGSNEFRKTILNVTGNYKF